MRGFIALTTLGLLTGCAGPEPGHGGLTGLLLQISFRNRATLHLLPGFDRLRGYPPFEALTRPVEGWRAPLALMDASILGHTLATSPAAAAGRPSQSIAGRPPRARGASPR
jgi:hypothetical protein